MTYWHGYERDLDFNVLLRFNNPLIRLYYIGLRCSGLNLVGNISSRHICDGESGLQLICGLTWPRLLEGKLTRVWAECHESKRITKLQAYCLFGSIVIIYKVNYNYIKHS